MRKYLTGLGVFLMLIGSTMADSQTLIPTIITMSIGAILALVGVPHAEK